MPRRSNGTTELQASSSSPARLSREAAAYQRGDGSMERQMRKRETRERQETRPRMAPCDKRVTGRVATRVASCSQCARSRHWRSESLSERPRSPIARPPPPTRSPPHMAPPGQQIRIAIVSVFQRTSSCLLSDQWHPSFAGPRRSEAQASRTVYPRSVASFSQKPHGLICSGTCSGDSIHP